MAGSTIGTRSASARPMHAATRATAVLLVDDEPVVREFFREALVSAGLQVTALPFAEDALQLLRSDTPDVIVLDLGMPRGRMQGMEMLVQLRDVEAWRGIPVVILSAYGDIVNRDVTARLGVTDVLTKPLLDVDSLVAAIRRATS
jgi:CheY-like chemotaxis protein